MEIEPDTKSEKRKLSDLEVDSETESKRIKHEPTVPLIRRVDEQLFHLELSEHETIDNSSAHGSYSSRCRHRERIENQIINLKKQLSIIDSEIEDDETIHGFVDGEIEYMLSSELEEEAKEFESPTTPMNWNTTRQFYELVAEQDHETIESYEWTKTNEEKIEEFNNTKLTYEYKQHDDLHYEIEQPNYLLNRIYDIEEYIEETNEIKIEIDEINESMYETGVEECETFQELTCCISVYLDIPLSIKDIIFDYLLDYDQMDEILEVSITLKKILIENISLYRQSSLQIGEEWPLHSDKEGDLSIIDYLSPSAQHAIEQLSEYEENFSGDEIQYDSAIPFQLSRLYGIEEILQLEYDCWEDCFEQFELETDQAEESYKFTLEFIEQTDELLRLPSSCIDVTGMNVPDITEYSVKPLRQQTEYEKEYEKKRDEKQEQRNEDPHTSDYHSDGNPKTTSEDEDDIIRGRFHCQLTNEKSDAAMEVCEIMTILAQLIMDIEQKNNSIITLEQREQLIHQTEIARNLVSDYYNNYMNNTELSNYLQDKIVLSKIRVEQSTTDTCILPQVFTEFVQDTIENGYNHEGKGYDFTPEALEALHIASEEYLIDLLESSNLCAIAADRQMILPRDIQLTRRLRNERY